MRTLLVFLLFLFSNVALGFTGQSSETFRSATYKDTVHTTAVWNLATNTVHPPFFVSVTPPSNNDDFPVDIGDGSNGNFDVPTYANFGTISGTPGNYTLTINTNLWPVFNFTNFNLAAGWTITGVGSNGLWIKVQGNFTNSGTINCSGTDGSPVSNNISVAPSGGIGFCGGANGGTGGFSSVPDGQNGGDGGAPLNTHGSGGTHSTTVALPFGGGGGGSYGNAAPTAGSGTVAGSGLQGAEVPDPTCVHLGNVADGPGSGSGGGGGGAYLHPDGFLSSGAGGGAGGGIIHIAIGGSLTQNSTGQILANGGNGGAGNASLGGAPGGGGGGGTIIIHAGGLMVDNGLGITANGGSFGSVGMAGSSGGLGADGREWLSEQDGNQPSGSDFNQTPGFGGPNWGQVHYDVLSSYIIQSLGYDSLNTSPTYAAFNVLSSLPGASTATLTVAGSNDNFVLDNTGFVPISSLSQLSGKRFFRFNIQLQSDSSIVPALTPAQVSLVSANFSGSETK